MSDNDEEHTLQSLDALVRKQQAKHAKPRGQRKRGARKTVTDLQAAGTPSDADADDEVGAPASSLGNLSIGGAQGGTPYPSGGSGDSDDDSSSSSAPPSSSSSDERIRRRQKKKKTKKKATKHRYEEKEWKALKYYGCILAGGNKSTVLEVVEQHAWRGPGVYHQQRRNAQAVDAMVKQFGLEVCSDILGFEILVRSTYGLFLSDIEGEVKLTEMYEWAPPQSFADPLSLRSKLKVVERWNKATERREQKKKGGGAARGKGGAKA